MTSFEALEQFRVAAKSRGFWKHGFSFPHRAKQLFGDFDFADKSILEIGCGRGEYCLWAGIHGAAHVVGLEPCSSGFYDADNFFNVFADLAAELGLHNVKMVPALVQDYDAPEETVDCTVSVASINHIDEEACINLRNNSDAWNHYVNVFRKIRRAMKPGGVLIIVDVQPRNLFPDLGVKNPFLPHIEWLKHQPPEVWASLLRECGFRGAKISWLSNQNLLRLGMHRIPRFLSYCTGSLFRLEMRAN